MDKKISVDLTGVPKTLLIPLLARAEFSNKDYSPIHDLLASDLVKHLDYDFTSLSQHMGHLSWFMNARAWHFDQAIIRFYQQNPEGVIINLGAGLDTTFYRHNLPGVAWYDLDLPNIMSLRQSLLPHSDQITPLAKSVFDFSWMDSIKQPHNRCLLFAGGLFMYFEEYQVRQLLTSIANQFQGSEMIFDTISTNGLYYANKMLSESDMSNARMHWGIDDTTTLESWSNLIRVCAKFPCFTNIKNMEGIPLGSRIKMYLYDWFDKSSMTHITFLRSHTT